MEKQISILPEKQIMCNKPRHLQSTYIGLTLFFLSTTTIAQSSTNSISLLCKHIEGASSTGKYHQKNDPERDSEVQINFATKTCNYLYPCTISDTSIYWKVPPYLSSNTTTENIINRLTGHYRKDFSNGAWSSYRCEESKPKF